MAFAREPLLNVAKPALIQTGSTSTSGATPFEIYTIAQLKASLKVLAGRSHGYVGFNNPEIQLHLPRSNNSNFVRLEMLPPKLVDSQGLDVPYELERGIHDIDTQTIEIRFLTEGGTSPAKFSRAIGEIVGSYPLEIETLMITPNQASGKVRITGSSIEVDEGVLPQTPPFLEKQPLRAFGPDGQALKQTGNIVGHHLGERAWKVFTFEGNIAKVEVDTIAKEAKVHIRYDIPIVAPLPIQMRAAASKDVPPAVADPDSRIEFDIELVQPAKPKTNTQNQAKALTKPKKAAAPKKKVKSLGKAIPISTRASLSKEGQIIAQGVADLKMAIPETIAVVQMIVSSNSVVILSEDSNNRVQQWEWNSGEISGPEVVDTQWIKCKKGLSAKALTLDRIPSLYDDAAKQVATGESALQLVVGQFPCGTAYTHVSFESGASVTYLKDGQLSKVE